MLCGTRTKSNSESIQEKVGNADNNQSPKVNFEIEHILVIKLLVSKWNEFIEVRSESVKPTLLILLKENKDDKEMINMNSQK